MKQLFTIAKIGGIAGEQVLSHIKSWCCPVDDSARKELADSVGRQVQNLVTQLRLHADEPPVLFFAEYIDVWSMGDTVRRFAAPKAGNTLLEVFSHPSQLWA